MLFYRDGVLFENYGFRGSGNGLVELRLLAQAMNRGLIQSLEE
jgi:hypothetical protein